MRAALVKRDKAGETSLKGFGSNMLQFVDDYNPAIDSDDEQDGQEGQAT